MSQGLRIKNYRRYTNCVTSLNLTEWQKEYSNMQVAEMQEG